MTNHTNYRLSSAEHFSADNPERKLRAGMYARFASREILGLCIDAEEGYGVHDKPSRGITISTSAVVVFPEPAVMDSYPISEVE